MSSSGWRPLPQPGPKRFLVLEKDFRGRQLGVVEQAASLEDASEMAAVMLDRAEARPVAALTDETRGVFIAHGRVPWMIYGKREVVKEIRFALVLDKKDMISERGKP